MLCLLCSRNPIVVESIPVAAIIEAYREKLSFDLDPEYFKRTNVELLLCEKCDFSFFDENPGTSDFYQLCKSSKDYFEPWRWEFSLTQTLLKSAKIKRHLDIGSGLGIFASSISGHIDEVYASDYIFPSYANPDINFVFSDNHSFTQIIDKRLISHIEGNLYAVTVPSDLISEYDREISEFRFFEDSKMLSQPASQHKKISELGHGRWSHWKDTLYFSTEDNSNPINNKSIYRIESRTLPKNYFDSISLFHTLEHVDNPLEFLISLKRYFKKKGKIFVSVPNFSRSSSVGAALDIDILDFPPHHISRWKPINLINIFNMAGIKPLYIYFEPAGSSIYGPLINQKTNSKTKITQNKLYINDAFYAYRHTVGNHPIENNDLGYSMMIEGIIL